MKAILKKIWGHILIWGVLSILFGIISFAWPGLTLTTLVYLFAIAVIAEGIAILAGAWQARDEEKLVDHAADRHHQYCCRHYLHCESWNHGAVLCDSHRCQLVNYRPDGDLCRHKLAEGTH